MAQGLRVQTQSGQLSAQPAGQQQQDTFLGQHKELREQTIHMHHTTQRNNTTNKHSAYTPSHTYTSEAL